MGLIKCPRCELNYMLDTEKICSVCRRDVRGEPEQDDILELCSECGEHPAMPGQELCVYCLKELQRRSAVNVTDDAIPAVPEDPTLEIDSVSTMDEIALDLPDDIEDAPFDETDDEFTDDDDDDEDDESESVETPFEDDDDDEDDDEDEE